jgi:hypothetical protein
MSLQIQIVGLLLSLAFFTFVLRQIRGRILRPFYVLLWVAFSIFLFLIFAASDQIKWLSDHIFAFNDSRHFVYLVCFGFLFVYAFYATLVVNKLQDEVRVLISELGILRTRVDRASRIKLSDRADHAPSEEKVEQV